MKAMVISSTMVGAGALSMKKERYTPRKDGNHRDDDGNRQHGAEFARHQEGDGSRGNQHGNGEDDADGLQCADDGQGKDRQQSVVQQPDRQSDRSRLRRVECVQEEVPPFDDEDAGRNGRDNSGLDDVA